jgi:hypothetical protein
MQVFQARLEELECADKMYCPEAACSKFINLEKLPRPLGRHACGGCGADVCTACKARLPACSCMMWR